MKNTKQPNPRRQNGLFRGALIGLLTILAGVVHAESRPNVVFLLSDDQGWSDYGFMGHPHVQTPNLDRLASEGLLYERGYVTAPLCRPSLASLVTGLYPHETGIRGNDPVLPLPKTAYLKPGNDELRAQWVDIRNRMTAAMLDKPSMVKSLKEHGYLTLQTGKWWEGNPLNHGFTDAMTHGDPAKDGRHGDDGLLIGRKTMQPIVDFVAKAQANDQPFFIWYGVYLPHTPHNAPERLYNKYKDIAPNEPTAKYWANVEWLDETCGQLIDHLKEQGLYENTLFVYTCDNGWLQNPEKVGYSIRSKREATEMGIRTPIFVTHPGAIEPRREAKILASNIDVATTILHACGITPPAAMTGLDLRHPEALAKRDRIFVDVYQGRSNIDQLADLDAGLDARVVIDGWDKLIARPKKSQLFDLKNDPDDRTDIAASNPEKVKELSAMIEAWLNQ